MSTTRIMDVGGRAVIVEFERKRIKNVNVRVRRDGSLYASMPYWVSYAEAERFIQSKASFFVKALDEVARRSADEDAWKNMDKESVENLKKLIAELIELHMPFFAARGVARPSKIVIGNYRSFWGECMNKRGILKFSTRLAGKDRGLVEYVVVHELSHFLVPNHSEAFWNLVGSVIPDYKVRRKILNGKAVKR
ncbi:MAG: M48 family metallopeptidase [Clostridiales bacterium]|nr:M48 family metallopeptidase [Clostridiales bacterium]